MPTNTTNYSLLKPLVNNATDQDLWGGYLNDDIDDIDTLLRAGITVATQSSQTTGFTADASISVKKLYPCDATGGGFSATIPAAATAANGATVFIKKTDSSANAVTLARSGADTLDGATSLTLSLQNDCYGLVSDGVSAWRSITQPSAPTATTSTKGIVQLATAAEVLAGSDTSKVATPDALAGNKSLAANGYYKLPGGLIIQWGTSGSISAGNTGAVTFPLAFPSAVYGVLITRIGTGNNAQTADNASSVTTSGFTIQNGNSLLAYTYYWGAIGV